MEKCTHNVGKVEKLRIQLVMKIYFVELKALMWYVDDAVVNPSDLPKLVSRVSQCSTEWSAEPLRMGGIYTLESARGKWDKHGCSPVSTLLWATLFICVSHRGVNTQTR